MKAPAQYYSPDRFLNCSCMIQNQPEQFISSQTNIFMDSQYGNGQNNVITKYYCVLFSSSMIRFVKIHRGRSAVYNNSQQVCINRHKFNLKSMNKIVSTMEYIPQKSDVHNDDDDGIIIIEVK